MLIGLICLLYFLIYNWCYSEFFIFIFLDMNNLANSPPKKENFSQIHSRKARISQFFCWQKWQNLSNKITLMLFANLCFPLSEFWCCTSSAFSYDEFSLFLQKTMWEKLGRNVFFKSVKCVFVAKKKKHHQIFCKIKIQRKRTNKATLSTSDLCL